MKSKRKRIRKVKTNKAKPVSISLAKSDLLWAQSRALQLEFKSLSAYIVSLLRDDQLKQHCDSKISKKGA